MRHEEKPEAPPAIQQIPSPERPQDKALDTTRVAGRRHLRLLPPPVNEWPEAA